jgi:hypothetical protein
MSPFQGLLILLYRFYNHSTPSGFAETLSHFLGVIKELCQPYIGKGMF